MGKGVGRVAQLCREAKVPCIGLAGMLRGEYEQGCGEFSELASIVPRWADLKEAKRKPAMWLAKLAAETAARRSA